MMTMMSDQGPAPASLVPVPIDPECAAVLASVGGAFLVGVEPDGIGAARQVTAQTPPTNEELSRNGAYVVSERAVPGPAGAPDISLLVCLPAGAAPACPTPALYTIHSGGMILGNYRADAASMLGFAQEVGAAVISVKYRLAPETRHPGPVEDCYAGLLWTAAHLAELNIDPARLIVAGVSAGGGLSAAVALMARDRGGPALAGQLLSCPMLDDRNDTQSSLQMAGLGVWDHATNQTAWTALLGDARGGPDVSPYAAPIRAADLSGLPPAFIDVGSAETFRDEDVAYANRIWQAGGQAELHVWPGGVHGFGAIAPQSAIAQGAEEARRGWLRRLLTAS
jgi:acetyl esterase/lipase